MLEILRVVYTAADDDHLSIVGGSQQIPVGLWRREVEAPVHWPAGTSLASLHAGGRPPPPGSPLPPAPPHRLTVTDQARGVRPHQEGGVPGPSWEPLSRTGC